MRLLMATSRDGFVARGDDDEMRWTGSFDKALFRALTSVGGACGAGSTTYRLMPTLKGRDLYCITRHPRSRFEVTLWEFEARTGKLGWLIGGQLVALSALEEGLIQEVHLCRSDRMIFGSIPDRITPWMAERGWTCGMRTHVGDVWHERWRQGAARGA